MQRKWKSMKEGTYGLETHFTETGKILEYDARISMSKFLMNFTDLKTTLLIEFLVVREDF